MVSATLHCYEWFESHCFYLTAVGAALHPPAS
jgi:hypothetical protein